MTRYNYIGLYMLEKPVPYIWYELQAIIFYVRIS